MTTKKESHPISSLKAASTTSSKSFFFFAQHKPALKFHNLASSVYPNESASMTNVRRQRQGFYGWHGFGGSVLQWHPQKRVSFAYAPTLLAWYDPLSRKAATLQEEVVKCVDRLEKI